MSRDDPVRGNTPFDPTRVRFAGVGLKRRTKAGNEQRATNKLRLILVEKQGNRCHYCRRLMTTMVSHPPRPTDATVEHIIRRSEGGPLSLENCVAACLACNQYQDYVSKGTVFLRNRVRMFWRRLQGWLELLLALALASPDPRDDGEK